jgi:hypothetical protein
MPGQEQRSRRAAGRRMGKARRPGASEMRGRDLIDRRVISHVDDGSAVFGGHSVGFTQRFAGRACKCIRSNPEVQGLGRCGDVASDFVDESETADAMHQENMIFALRRRLAGLQDPKLRKGALVVSHLEQLKQDMRQLSGLVPRAQRGSERP